MKSCISSSFRFMSEKEKKENRLREAADGHHKEKEEREIWRQIGIDLTERDVERWWCMVGTGSSVRRVGFSGVLLPSRGVVWQQCWWAMTLGSDGFGSVSVLGINPTGLGLIFRGILKHACLSYPCRGLGWQYSRVCLD